MPPSRPCMRRGARPDQRGISLIEVILGVAILAVAMLAFVNMQSAQQDIQTGRTKGEELASVQSLFAQYFLTNRSEIMQAMAASAASDANVQKHCVIRVDNLNAAVNPGSTPGAAGPNGTLAWSGGAGINDGKKTCAFDLSLLQAKGLWPRNMSVTIVNPETGGAARWVAIVKRVRAAGPDNVPGNTDDTLGDDAQMLIVLADEDGALAINANAWKRDATLQRRVLSQSEVLGQSGGFIPVGNIGPCRAVNQSGANQIQVCGAGWSLDLNDWLDDAKYNALKGALPTN